MSLVNTSYTAAQKPILFSLMMADTALIHSHRLSEWCGHGPQLEQDIALTNVALDHLGQSRSWYQYAAHLCNALPVEERKGLFSSDLLNDVKTDQGKLLTEDDLAFLRDAWDFKNVLLAEQPNTHFGFTVARCFFMDAYNFYFFRELKQHTNETWSAIAEKSLKEVTYHLKWSSEWMIRLGDGTEESHEKMQEAVDELWSFTGELTQSANYYDEQLTAALPGVKTSFEEKVRAVLTQATLNIPEDAWMQKGGKTGQHTEYLGYILAEMQFVQRSYPGMEW